MSKQLVIESKHGNGWEFVFRKENGRPIEMVKRHKELGQLGGWQVAKNLCLKAIISYEELASHFGITEWKFHYSK